MELCSSVDCLYVFCIFAVINVNIYYAEFVFLFVLIIVSFLLSIYLLILGRGNSTADEGTCWLWTKEWWRNGCQNLR